MYVTTRTKIAWNKYVQQSGKSPGVEIDMKLNKMPDEMWTRIVAAVEGFSEQVKRILEEEPDAAPDTTRNTNTLTAETVRRIGLTLANAECKAGKLKDGTTRKAWTDGYIEAMTDMLLTLNVEFCDKDGVITVDGQTFPVPEKEVFPL